MHLSPPLPAGASFSIHGECVQETRKARAAPHAEVPVVGNDLTHREALFRVVNGRGENAIHWQFAEFPVQGKPPVNAAGNGDGQGTAGRNLRFAGFGNSFLHALN